MTDRNNAIEKNNVTNTTNTIEASSEYLTHVLGNTYHLDLNISIPVYYLDEKTIVLIDSGYGDDRSRPALFKYIDENNLKVRAVLTSHSHYDHLGNHIPLQQQYGAEIIMPELEAALVYNYQMIRPLYWHYTKREIQSTILETMMVKADRTFKLDQKAIDIDGIEFGLVSLLGHSPGHMGIITPDDVLYVGDAIINEELIKVSKLPTNVDWEEDYKTKEFLLKEKHSKYILAHSGIYDEIEDLVRLNMSDRNARLEELKEYIFEKDDWTLESIQEHMWDRLGLKTKNSFNHRVFSRNAFYMVNYMVEIGLLEPYPDRGVLHYRVQKGI